MEIWPYVVFKAELLRSRKGDLQAEKLIGDTYSLKSTVTQLYEKLL